MPLCIPYPEVNLSNTSDNQTNQEDGSDQAGYVMDAGDLDANWTLLTGNFSGNRGNGTLGVKREPWITINELQMIKVVVLVVVVGILLLSTCRIIFRTFSRYTGKKGDGD